MEQIEYASFVKELATAGFNSPRCPPETQYSRDFEHRMEALLVNCEIADETTFGQPSNQRSDQRKELESSFLGSCSTRSRIPKTSSMMEEVKDGAVSDESFSESDQKGTPCVSTYQRSSALESVDSGHGISTCQDSSCSIKEEQEGFDIYRDTTSSCKRELSFGQAMDVSFHNEMLDVVEEICTNNPPLNTSIFTSKPRSGPTKRTYDEANS